MAKDPILPLYYNDLDRSTRDWTDEELGAYVRLLMHQWDKGSLPNDYQRLTRIATSLSTTWPTVKEKFVEKNGGLINERMEEIRNKREVFKHRQREKVLKRYQTSTEHTTKLPTEKLPIEIENEIENKEGGIGETKIMNGHNSEFKLSLQLELPDMVLESAERNQFTHTKSKNTEFIRQQWKIFLSERLNDPAGKKVQYYTLGDYTSYFLNWIRNKFPKQEFQRSNENHRSGPPLKSL